MGKWCERCGGLKNRSERGGLEFLLGGVVFVVCFWIGSGWAWFLMTDAKYVLMPTALVCYVLNLGYSFGPTRIGN